MKKLYIIRHAKSSWKDLELDDFDRPLNKRGKLNAPFMGKKLKKKRVHPDIVIASPALRSRLTAEVIAKKVKYFKDIVYDEELYESSATMLCEALVKIEDKNNIAFLVGHSTGINLFVENYIDFQDNIPTCGVVEIEFNCKSWKDISEQNAKLISFDYPKKEL